MNERPVVGKIVFGKTDLPIDDLINKTKKLVRDDTIIIRIPIKRMRQIESRAKRAGLSISEYMLAAVDAFEAALKPRNRENEARETVGLVLMAINALGNAAAAGLWFNKPVRALGNKAPISLLHDPAGRKLVKNVIGRIKHGL